LSDGDIPCVFCSPKTFHCRAPPFRPFSNLFPETFFPHHVSVQPYLVSTRHYFLSLHPQLVCFPSHCPLFSPPPPLAPSPPLDPCKALVSFWDPFLGRPLSLLPAYPVLNLYRVPVFSFNFPAFKDLPICPICYNFEPHLPPSRRSLPQTLFIGTTLLFFLTLCEATSPPSAVDPNGR